MQQKLLTSLELGRTALSHNLKAVLKHFERHGELKVDLVHQWPTANIAITYGPETSRTNRGELMRRGTIPGLADDGASLALWILTQGRNGNPHHGITSIFYQRDNTICYTPADSFQKQAKSMVLALAILLNYIGTSNAPQRMEAQQENTTRLTR